MNLVNDILRSGDPFECPVDKDIKEQLTFFTTIWTHIILI